MHILGPIILIDDDNDDQDLFTELSRELMPDNLIHNFYNGLQALEYLRITDEKPFIIFCDMNMPGMNGLELLEIINKDYFLKSKSIPFIFFTTSAEPKAVQRSYDLGVQGFFKKPESIHRLREIMKLSFDFWRNCIHPKNFQK
jgi:CheY-like chemotaxis protein